MCSCAHCMGTCSSCSAANSSSAAADVDGGSSSLRSSGARVIDLHGSLAEFPVPVTSSQVLLLLSPTSSSTACFLCSSDALFVDARIPAVGPDEPLRPGQIYFVLPVSMLHYPLSVSDMAALATRASSAFSIGKDDEDVNEASGRTLQQQQRRPRRRVIRVRPVAAEVDEATCEVLNENISTLASCGVLPATLLVPQEPLLKTKTKRPSPLHVPTLSMKNKLTTIAEADE